MQITFGPRESERTGAQGGLEMTSGRAVTGDAVTGNKASRRRKPLRWLITAGLALAPLAGAGSACLDRPIGAPPPVTTNIFVDKITQTSVDKIDLLFMIDNSISMSDKQEILRRAVPDLVSRLVNPTCVDGSGNQTSQPADGETCLDRGETPEFNPINDINIGVVSSSLGDVGAEVACPTQPGTRFLADKVDMAHLMGSLERNRVARTGGALQPEGFLAWRAGSTQLDDFNRDFATMVQDVGELGCGWEASLESWYRFLVDPAPYERLVKVTCPGDDSGRFNCVQVATNDDQTVRRDETLLAQRARFLRPDSLVAIIMLSDENDCSMRVGGQSWVVAAIDDSRPMFKGTTACEVDPANPNSSERGANAKCCHSCAVDPPAGCSPDPSCDVVDEANRIFANRLAPVDDGQNLRCFQQKRRFGLDLLYPTQRYVNALTNFDICWSALDLSTEGCRAGDTFRNPLYEGGRLPSLVFLGGIIGVPWQAIQSAVDANGEPIPATSDLLRFKNFQELALDTGTGNTWDDILGDPGVAWRAASGTRSEVNAVAAVPPRVPQMIETAYSRGIAPNDINGREYDTTQGEASQGAADDLQYACIFPLVPTRDCATIDINSGAACDCFQGNLNRPLCEADPGRTPPGGVQYWSKAYPGTRHLEVLKDYGANSIVASICAREVEDTSRRDYGYRPAIAAIVDRLKEQLGDRCLPRALSTSSDGRVACTLVETLPQRPRNEAGVEQGCPPCDPALARKVPDDEVDAVVRGQLSIDRAEPCGREDPDCVRSCLCEVLQVDATTPNDGLRRCLNDDEVLGVEGWCYIDAERDIGSDALVENCPATERRLLRFVGQGLLPNSTTFVACTGSSFASEE